MIDEYIVEEEMDNLKYAIDNNKMHENKANNFFSDDYWEDDFSHNDIYEMQLEFMKQAQGYLKKICPNKYILYCDWCVHVCSVDFFNKYIKGHFHGYLKC